MSVPSIKTIEKFFAQQFRKDYGETRGPAVQLREILEELSRAERCGDGRTLSRVGDAVDKLLGGYGWEFISWGDVKGNGSEKLALSYLNMGDTYAGTVLVYPSGTIKLGAWGDFVESYSR
ncbi:MAG: hypothetical protein KC492_16365 [Myxococcales bacterium]|nr:hypothetical protein [Myxococcales bacterium]